MLVAQCWSCALSLYESLFESSLSSMCTLPNHLFRKQMLLISHWELHSHKLENMLFFILLVFILIKNLHSKNNLKLTMIFMTNKILVIDDACKKWHCLLEGAQHEVIMYSNHKKLSYFMNVHVLNWHQAQRALSLFFILLSCIILRNNKGN